MRREPPGGHSRSSSASGFPIGLFNEVIEVGKENTLPFKEGGPVREEKGKFATRIVGMGALPHGSTLDLGMVVSGSKGGSMDRVRVTFVLVANCDTVVWRGVGRVFRTPQAKIEVLGLRGRLICFNDEEGQFSYWKS